MKYEPFLSLCIVKQHTKKIRCKMNTGFLLFELFMVRYGYLEFYLLHEW